MSNKKSIRTRGKFQLSKFFQKLKEGDSVAVVKEMAMQPRFPSRLQGRTGIVLGKQGRAYKVKIKDQSKEKEYLIAPIHLKKLKQIHKQNDKE